MVVVNVQTIDAKSFQDHAPVVADVLATALEGRMSPRAAAALRNVVKGR
jgi:ribosomal protein S3